MDNLCRICKLRKGLLVKSGDSLPETICVLCLSKQNQEVVETNSFQEEVFEISEYQMKEEVLEEDTTDENYENDKLNCSEVSLAKNEELMMEKSEFDIQVKNEPVEEDLLEDEDSIGNIQPLEDWLKVEDTDITEDYSIDDPGINDVDKECSFSPRNSDIDKDCIMTDLLFKCPHCPKSFKRNSILQLHKRIHDKGRQQYKCSYCPMVFQQHSSLIFHVLVHTGERPFKCSQCEWAFKLEAHLQYHMKVHTKNQNLGIDKYQNPFQCSQCSKTFPQKSNLQNHLRRWHVEGKSTQCPHCPDSFPGTYSLLNHIRKAHPNVEYLKCPMCCKTFMLRSSLKEHMNIHSNKKQFQCTQCSEAFSVKRQLLKNIHCSQCSEVFNDHVILAKHMLIRHPKELR